MTVLFSAVLFSAFLFSALMPCLAQFIVQRQKVVKRNLFKLPFERGAVMGSGYFSIVSYSMKKVL